MTKKLQTDSKYAVADADGDGVKPAPPAPTVTGRPPVPISVKDAQVANGDPVQSGVVDGS